MFLKALYKFNKVYFVVSLGLLFTFLFINYKWGMVASPISQYGMYSGVYKIKTAKTLYTHIVNGEKLDAQRLSIIQNDFLQSFPVYYESEAEINKATFYTMLPYLNKMGLAHQEDSAKFLNHFSREKFRSWYIQKLSVIINNRVDSFKILQQQYIWTDGELKSIGAVSLINLN